MLETKGGVKESSYFTKLASCIRIWADDTFYFYDGVINGRLADTDNKKLVGLRIVYNADSTCKIIIKLSQKGVVDDES